MTTLRILALSLFFLALPAALPAQTPAEPSELASLRDGWQRATLQVTAPIDKRYQDALVALKLRFTKEGRLTEALAVDTELKKVSKGTELPKAERATLAGILGTWSWASGDKSDQSTIQFEKDGTGSHGGRGNTTWEASGRDVTITHPTKGKAVIKLKPDGKSFAGTGYDGKPVTGKRMN